MNRRATIAVVVVAALVALPPTAASAKGITGHCGIHFGALYRIDSSGARYHSRIGPRDGHVGGTMHCYGQVFIRRSGGRAEESHLATLSDLGVSKDESGGWEAFNFTRWNWHGILALNGTAATCVGFGVALAGEAPSGAVDTWLTASAGAGCVGGVAYVAKTYLNGHTADYCGAASSACNGPGRVLLR